MKRKNLFGFAVLATVVTFILITFMVTDGSAQMRKMGRTEMMGAQTDTAPCPMTNGMGMGQRGMMGSGMGKGVMGMSCPMMGAGVDIEVKKLKDGVTITYRSEDGNTAKRLQIMGEMMMLMGEMMELKTREK